MQKLINVVALLSGLTSLSIIGGGAYLYLNKDAMIENAKDQVAKAAAEAITAELPRLIDAAMPEIPEMPSVTGGAIPGGML